MQRKETLDSRWGPGPQAAFTVCFYQLGNCVGRHCPFINTEIYFLAAGSHRAALGHTELGLVLSLPQPPVGWDCKCVHHALLRVFFSFLFLVGKMIGMLA